MNKTKIKIKNNIYFIVFLIIYYFSLSLIFSDNCYATDPTLVLTLKKAFEKIKNYIIKLATPIAAVALGTGALMKKFSFGDEEKIRTGKKLIRGSLFSYAFILCIDMILSLVETLLD